MFVYLVFQVFNDDLTPTGRPSTDLQGVFSRRSKAVAACKAWNFCIVKQEVDSEEEVESREFGADEIEWPIPMPEI